MVSFFCKTIFPPSTLLRAKPSAASSFRCLEAPSKLIFLRVLVWCTCHESCQLHATHWFWELESHPVFTLHPNLFHWKTPGSKLTIPNSTVHHWTGICKLAMSSQLLNSSRKSLLNSQEVEVWCFGFLCLSTSTMLTTALFKGRFWRHKKKAPAAHLLQIFKASLDCTQVVGC